MQFFANKYIRISDISAYLLCPRLAYFRRKHPKAAVSPEVVRAAVFKELSRSLAGVLAADDPASALRSNIEATCHDAEIVYCLPTEEIMEEAMGAAADIVGGLRSEARRIGRSRLLAMLNPHERPQVIYSDRLRISGSVDRIVVLDGARVPVVVCASRPPENGAFAADRVKLAACTMLVEEKYGGAVDRGIVEYACGWRIRETEIRKSDRMAALSARNRIAQTGTAMPEARRGAWCAACHYGDACNVSASLLSGLFKPMLTDNIGLSRNETNK